MDSVSVKFPGRDLQILFAGDFANLPRDPRWPFRTHSQWQRDDWLRRIHRDRSAMFESCRNEDSLIIHRDEIGLEHVTATAPNEFEQVFPTDFLQAVNPIRRQDRSDLRILSPCGIPKWFQVQWEAVALPA